MEPWQAAGIGLLPELTEAISQADDPMQAWIEISGAFREAYQEPRNEDLIRRIYQFAFWCLEHGEREGGKHGTDLPTCVVIGFLESVPAEKASREDMPRWFSREEVLLMRETFTCSYSGGFEELLALFDPPVSLRKARRGDARRYREYWRNQIQRA